MDAILTVTTPAASYNLTTVDRVKRELDIADKRNDAILADWVREESATFANLVDRVLASEAVSETFRFGWQRGLPPGYGFQLQPDADDDGALQLRRYPVSAVTSVTEDGITTLAASDYELNAEAGLLYRLDGAGCRLHWYAGTVVVAYTGGYVLPSGLPPKIESAVITLVKNRWFARKRDPAVKVTEVTGVLREEFWVGPIGDGLPQDVQEAVDLFRDVRI